MTGQTRSDWTRKALERAGFSGWIPWSACPEALVRIPQNAGGVYVVYRTGLPTPSYLDRSPAGTFRGDPAVVRESLEANWVRDARVVYIGKADQGRLRKRLEEFIDFGRGGKRRHWGGRLIWQLAQAEDLLIAWRVLPSSIIPRDVETEMINAFRTAYGKPPFANNPDRLGG